MSTAAPAPRCRCARVLHGWVEDLRLEWEEREYSTYMYLFVVCTAALPSQRRPSQELETWPIDLLKGLLKGTIVYNRPVLSGDSDSAAAV